jgi:hypothetical protein
MRFPVVLAVMAVVLAVPGAAHADPPADVVRYSGGLTPSGAVADGSGNDLHGTVLTGTGGAVASLAAPDGNLFLRFPAGTCVVAPCPQGIVQPPVVAAFTPGAEQFTYGADIRLTEAPSPAAGMNVFQYGAAGANLSQWKLQVDYGRPSCRWSDGTTVVLLMAGPPGYQLPIGAWHRVRCARLSPTLFEIRVLDPVTGDAVVPPEHLVARLGPVTPVGVVVIGGKRIRATQSDVDTDQFHGDLDELYYRASA